MITLETLESWLNTPVENERLEFKEAKRLFSLPRSINFLHQILEWVKSEQLLSYSLIRILAI